MKRTFVRTLLLGCLYLLASGHVGSPDTWFEGQAGPYHVIVQIETAGVVPGVANVFVRAVGDQPDNVSINANKFDATGGAPPPENAPRVTGEPGLFSGRLWLMTTGSNSVTVSLSGKKGQGKVTIPVVVVAYSQLKLDKTMGAGLAGMGLVLFAGLVTIVGAAVREGSLAPGQAPSPQTKRRARNAMALTALFVAVLLAGGWRWWNREDASYQRNLYRPLASTSSIVEKEGRRFVQVAIAESAWINRRDTSWLRSRGGNSWTPLITDHGKIMHLFLVRDDMSAFAHLHPETQDSVLFPAPLPPLPAGHYRVFADIVHESGFTHTLVSRVVVPASTALTAAVGNSDDSWFAGTVASANKATLEDGYSMEWQRGSSSLAAGQPAELKFLVRNPDGTPATLTPYMGMPGHAVVQRDDASVFVHLHPMGTISVASQMAFEMREPGDTVRGTLGKRIAEAGMSQMQHSPPIQGSVSFPFAFPREGKYRIWVQTKVGERVMTAAFDAEVEPAPSS